MDCAPQSQIFEACRNIAVKFALFSRLTAAHSTVRASGWVHAALCSDKILIISPSHHEPAIFPAGSCLQLSISILGGHRRVARVIKGKALLSRPRAQLPIHLVEST